MRPMETIYFEEEMKIKQWVKYLIIFAGTVQVFAMIIIYFNSGFGINDFISFKNEEAFSLGLSACLSILIYLPLFLLIKNYSLQIYYTFRGIYIQMKPFKSFFIAKEDILDIEIKAIPYFTKGHYGINWSLKYGKIYSMSTEYGVFIHTNSGKRYLISTENTAKIYNVIEKFNIKKIK